MMNRTEAGAAIQRAAGGWRIRAAVVAPVGCLSLIDDAGADFDAQDAADAARLCRGPHLIAPRGGWDRFRRERNAEKIGRILDEIAARGWIVETVDAWDDGAGACTVSLEIVKPGAKDLAEYYAGN